MPVLNFSASPLRRRLGKKTGALLLLGLVFNFNGLWVNLGYAGLGAAVDRRLAPRQQGMNWLPRLAGVMFIGFGLKLALTDNPLS